jgi:hypothetical protein
MKKKTTGKGDPEANHLRFYPTNGGYEKWARETLIGKTGPFETESAEWFAERIIQKNDKVRFLLGENAANRPTVTWRYQGEAADRAASEAFRLGQFCFWWEEIFVRNRPRQNENILIGVMARVANQKRGKKRGAQISAERQDDHKLWKKEAEKVWKKKPGASKVTVAGIVKKHLKSPAAMHTIRQVI